MKQLILLVLFATAFSVNGAEVRFRKQPLPRSNEIVIGKTHLSVTRDTSVPSGWAVHAVNGTETRKQPLNRNGINRIFFPGVILEMQNWNVSQNESWNIMAETIGEFEVRELTPAEAAKQGTAQLSTEKRRPGETMILSNGMVTLEILPAVNGMIPCIRSEISGTDIAFVGNLNRDMTLHDFTGVGFMEIFNSWGNTPMAVLTGNFENGKLHLSGKSGAGKDLTFQREMQLYDNSSAFRIASSVIGTGKLPMVKHRPEIRLPGKFGANALAMFLPEKGRLFPGTVQSGSYTLNGTAYALGDKETGMMLGVCYQNSSEIYLYVADVYMTLEASGLVPKDHPVAPLTVLYFFVHGLSRADFIGEGLLLAVPEKIPVCITGNKLPLEFTLGNAFPLQNAVFQLEIRNEKGELLSSQKKKLPAMIPGFASSFVMDAETGKLPSGRFNVQVSVLESGKKNLEGTFSLQMLSLEDLQKSKDFLKILDQRIEAIRQEKVSPEGKRVQMKKLRKVLLLRKEYSEALDAGDMDRVIELQKQ